ncbi:hypothetical protein G3N18_09830 [Microbacterium sp. 2C]|uniref:DUF6221 family protein n=1 Tax=Microbacterium paulum TaxID=2707006 RepID=UPI0018C21534|nr:hypothetical protein [Microbacterium paulum]
MAFVEARIADDERIAMSVAEISPTADREFCTWMTTFVLDPGRYIVAVDYQRVLADCAAKRRMVAAYLEVESHPSWNYAAAADYMETVVRDIAGIYADHPDYREEWRELGPLT